MDSSTRRPADRQPYVRRHGSVTGARRGRFGEVAATIDEEKANVKWPAERTPERPPCDTRCMFNVPVLDSSDVETFYESLAHQLEALLGDETDLIANLANTAALLWHTVPQINWAGFYLLRDDELVLGPFQGKPACVRIAVGAGVCGTAVATDASIRVDDVHEFPGHIACDDASRSELVVPVRADGRVICVLDLDSPLPGRFTPADQEGCERLARVIERSLAGPGVT